MRNAVGFETVFVSDSITRPSNTTAYAAGDAISEVTSNDYFKFKELVPTTPGRRSATLNTVKITSSANQSTKLDAELWLFKDAFTETADNSAFAPTDAELADVVAIVDIPSSFWIVGNAGSGASGNAIIEITNLEIPIQGDKDVSGSVYGQLVARNAYTPVSAEVFTVQLVASQD